MHATYTQPTRTAEDRTMIAFSAMGIPNRRLARVAFTLLATVMLLAMSPDVKAQVVLSKGSVTVPEDGTSSESYGVRLAAFPDGTPLSVTVTVTVPRLVAIAAPLDASVYE